ncbi:MAG: hypothetical protein WD552_00535 [Candidatus Paceibacterota bacterium]
MPEQDNNLSNEPELQNQKKALAFRSFTGDQESRLHNIDPANTPSPYEDPCKAERHFPKS